MAGRFDNNSDVVLLTELKSRGYVIRSANIYAVDSKASDLAGAVSSLVGSKVYWETSVTGKLRKSNSGRVECLENWTIPLVIHNLAGSGIEVWPWIADSGRQCSCNQSAVNRLIEAAPGRIRRPTSVCGGL